MDKILNLGCNEDIYGNFRVDVRPTKATTHVFDVEKGIQFPDEYFDVVYERSLLEHIRNVGFHLAEIHRVLKKNGKLTIITDNSSCLRYYIFRTHTGGYMGHRQFLEHDGFDKHYCIFTPEHIKNLLLETRFKIIDIRLVDTDFKPTFFLDQITRRIPLISNFTYPRIFAEALK